jgi:transcription antitermination factor NusG
MEKNWHVAVTRSRFEKKSNTILMQNGFETYLPLTREFIQWSDRKKWVEKPLFPGYIFIKFGKKERYNVLCVDGIAKIVNFENKDCIIDEKLIIGISELLKNNSKPQLLGDLDCVIGDEVKITQGPFVGMTGKLAKINGKTKIMVAIMAIGQGILLELNGNEVEKIQYNT